MEAAVGVVLETYSSLTAMTKGTMQKSAPEDIFELPTDAIISFKAGNLPSLVSDCNFTRPGREGGVNSANINNKVYRNSNFFTDMINASATTGTNHFIKVSEAEHRFIGDRRNIVTLGHAMLKLIETKEGVEFRAEGIEDPDHTDYNTPTCQNVRKVIKELVENKLARVMERPKRYKRQREARPFGSFLGADNIVADADDEQSDQLHGSPKRINRPRPVRETLIPGTTRSRENFVSPIFEVQDGPAICCCIPLDMASPNDERWKTMFGKGAAASTANTDAVVGDVLHFMFHGVNVDLAIVLKPTECNGRRIAKSATTTAMTSITTHMRTQSKAELSIPNVRARWCNPSWPAFEAGYNALEAVDKAGINITLHEHNHGRTEAVGPSVRTTVLRNNVAATSMIKLAHRT